MIVAAWWWLASAGDAGAGADRPFRKTGLRVLRAVPEGSDPVEFDRRHLLRNRSPKTSPNFRRYPDAFALIPVENGLDVVPELASRVGLKVILGVWLGRDRVKNASLIDSAARGDRATSGHRHRRIMVGSEVLLRGEMTRVATCGKSSARSERA